MKKQKPLPVRLEAEKAVSSVVPPNQEYFFRIKHSVNIGDIIAALPCCKKYWEITGRKIVFAQTINRIAQYYPGAIHPTVDERGQNVCVNLPMWEMIKPLVESQPYIHAFEKYEGQNIDLDFDVIRGKTFVNMPNGMIQSWLMYAFPDLAIDLSKPWVTLPPKPHPIEKKSKGKVIINFTERYRNQSIDYFFLKNYAPDLIFSGTEKEHWNFCNQWQLNIPRLDVKNFLELAYALRTARFMLGNQSFLWNLAEAMKTPRILEVSSLAPNCAPFIGEDSYGYYHQVGAEYYFKVLFNKKAPK